MELPKVWCIRGYFNACWWWCLKVIDHCDCPHILLTKILEIYGHPNTPPLPDDHDSECHVPLHSLDRIPYDDISMQELTYLECFESSDEDIKGSTNASSPLETIDVPSPSVIHYLESLIEAYIIPTHQDIQFSRLEITGWLCFRYCRLGYFYKLGGHSWGDISLLWKFLEVFLESPHSILSTLIGDSDLHETTLEALDFFFQIFHVWGFFPPISSWSWGFFNIYHWISSS